MPGVVQLSDAKRNLLQAYLHGRKEAASVGSSSITRRIQRRSAPLALAQEQIWLNAQKTGVPPFYNESITIHRRGPLDLAVLERSLTEIMRRHEAWRTTFDLVDGHPVQIIHQSPNVSVPDVDLRALPESERESEALRLAKVEVLRPFDLRTGPLFRATLMRLGEEEYRLCLAVHQIIIDGVTAYQVLLPELVALYEAFSNGQSSPLPELPIDYADFACWQRDWLGGKVLESQQAYWRQQLAGTLPVLQWPNSRPRPPKQTFRGAIQPFALPPELSNDLRTLSQSEGSTLFVTLLAGFFALLHCYTKETDIIVGTVSPAGRKRLEVQQLMGYFLNPVALRADLTGDPTFREVISRIQRLTVGALSNDDVPFEHVVEIVRPKTDPSRNPFFQVAASLEPSLPNLAPSWDLTPMDAENGGARWDLYLVWDDRSSGTIGRVQYNPDLFDVADIDRMLADQQMLLREIASNPQVRLSDIAINKLRPQWSAL